MGLTKHGVNVECGHCKCDSINGDGSFDVKVPVYDSNKGIAGSAILRCVISSKHHQIELKKWADNDNHSISSLEDIQESLSETLNFVADKKICGNSHICPSQVVQFVDEYNKD